jgi:hypothetical protein
MHIRRDVTLANLSLMGTDWHVRQLQRSEVPLFDAARAAPLWRQAGDSAGYSLGAATIPRWQHPDGPVLAETLGELDSIPAWTQLQPGTVMKAGSLSMRFAGDTPSRSAVVAALLIHDNIGKRPIFFAMTSALFPEEALGLTGHMLTQGMVRKVMTDSVVVGGEISDSQYLGMVDLARTKALMFEVYHRDTATRERPGGWYDPPSADMLGIYLRLYGAFAPVLQEHGDTVLAAEAVRTAMGVRKAIEGR